MPPELARIELQPAACSRRILAYFEKHVDASRIGTGVPGHTGGNQPYRLKRLAWSLRQDPRVEVCERTHVLKLPPELCERRFDGITCDLSFISLRTVVPALIPLLRPGGVLILLIKPQFEVGREAVGKGGVVRDPVAREEAIDRIRQLTVDLGLSMVGTVDSPIRGPKGNLEALLVARKQS